MSQSRGELIAEHICLRRQLIVLERQVARPKLEQLERPLLVVLTSRLKGRRKALVVAKPETLIGWHRQGFRLYWWRRLRVQHGRPRPAAEAFALIEETVLNNQLMRAKRIQG